MKIIETQVYQYSELSDSAKERARQWWIEGMDSNWSEYVTDDAKECAAILGIDIDQVYWSGFSCQGDGACFIGRYNYAKQSAANIRKHAPQDAELHRIADSLVQVQRKAFYRLSASITHRGNYSHEYCMDIESESYDLAEPLRAFARWIYRNLEREYECQTSDESIADCMAANEYTFTKGGKRFA